MNKRLGNWVNWVLYDELMNGQLNAPKHLLGIHDYGEGQVITVYRPHSESVSVTSVTGKNPVPMEELAEGFYGVYFPKKNTKETSTKLKQNIMTAQLCLRRTVMRLIRL